MLVTHVRVLGRLPHTGAISFATYFQFRVQIKNDFILYLQKIQFGSDAFLEYRAESGRAVIQSARPDALTARPGPNSHLTGLCSILHKTQKIYKQKKGPKIFARAFDAEFLPHETTKYYFE